MTTLDPKHIRTPQRRRPAPKTGRIRNLPVTIRFGLPLGLVAWLGYQIWSDSVGADALLVLRDQEGAALTEAEMELFAYEDEGHAPSPSPSIGRVDLAGDGSYTISGDLFGHHDRALARLRAPGSGFGFVLLERGAREQVVLGQPAQLSGRVTGPAPFLGDARIQVFGGGARGVLLAEAVTATDGSFQVDGISDAIPYLHGRVLQKGFAMAEAGWTPGSDFELELVPTISVQGRVLGMDQLPPPEPGQYRVVAYRVPGVAADLGGDGAFSIDHLPPPPQKVPLLLTGLDPAWTHRRCSALAKHGTAAEIRVERSAVVRGQVINGNTRQGLPRAKVLHDHGPHGHEVVSCDSEGFFEIGRLPSGRSTLRADVRIVREVRGRKIPRYLQAAVEVDVLAGETLEDIVLAIY